MLGDSVSDMQFAEQAGLGKVWIGEAPDPETKVDLVCPSLASFSQLLSELER
jgi:histidinol phosphatase-like enzyme